MKKLPDAFKDWFKEADRGWRTTEMACAAAATADVCDCSAPSAN